MGRRRTVTTRLHHGVDPINFNNGTDVGHAMVSRCHSKETEFTLTVENDSHLSFIGKKLRSTMIELASSELGHTPSVEEINHIEFHLHEISHAFQTPDHHPPYSEMIYRAIEALDKEGQGGSGSSRELMSSYIVSHYQDLPWAHERILSSHLGKLVDTGEIVTNPNGSYSFPKNMKTPQLLLEHPGSDMGVTDPDANPLAIVAVDDSETKNHACKRGRTPKPKLGWKKVVNLKMGQSQETEGKTEEIAGEPKQAKRRGRGRPRKIQNMEEKVEVEAAYQQPKGTRGRGKRSHGSSKHSKSQCRR